MNKISQVAVVESNYIYLQGLNRIFGRSPFRVSVECSCIDDIWNLVQPDSDLAAILLDINSDIEMLEDNISRIRVEYPQTKIVLMAESLSDADLARIVEFGPDGLILKSVHGKAIIKSLELILLGERVFPAEALRSLWQNTTMKDGAQQSPGQMLYSLSEREIQVLESLSEGNANKVIARHLGISESTVKVHVKSILRKTQAKNRTEAALWAREMGIGRISA
jgi:two-component system nitrate/nitrite response regulator NarL